MKKWFFVIILQLIILFALVSVFLMHVAEIIDINEFIDIGKIEKIIEDISQIRIVIGE